MEPVEDAGQRLGRAGQRRMRGHVVDALAVDPELPLGAAQPFEELFTGPGAHGLLHQLDRRRDPARGKSGPSVNHVGSAGRRGSAVDGMTVRGYGGTGGARRMTNTEAARALYARARKERFALGAFNIDNQETLIAVARAAAARRSPVLVEASH